MVTSSRVASALSALALLVALTIVGPPSSAHGGGHVRGDIVFATFDEAGNTSIRVVRPDGSMERTVAGFGYDPRWSPTRREIAIAGCESATPGCTTTIVKPDGRVLRRLRIPRQFDPASTAFGPTVWSPNGRRLAGGVDTDDAALNGIYTVRSADGRRLRRVTSNPGGEDVVGSYSPDGRWIVFVRNAPSGDRELIAQGLYVVRLDGTHLHRITPSGVAVNPEHGGRWSPNGRTILFDARPADGARFTLWTIRVNGANLHRIPVPLPCGGLITDPASFGCFAPAWAPDGWHIAFGTNDAATGDREIYTSTLDGHDLKQVTFGPVATDVPDWR